jgi:anti-anti-sigma factor
LEVRSEVADGVTVYRIAGRIDASSSQNLESAVGSAVSGGSPRVVLDMREVTFITSAGLRVIVMMARQAAAAKGNLAIFGLQPPVNEVFEIAGLQKIIPIASDETEARSKLGA